MKQNIWSLQQRVCSRITLDSLLILTEVRNHNNANIELSLNSLKIFYEPSVERCILKI